MLPVPHERGYRWPSPHMAAAQPMPPWRLLSPHCVVYTVRDETALELLAAEACVRPSNMKQLVGLQKNSTANLPRHKGGWQLVDRAWWVARDPFQTLAAVSPVPISGANGTRWVADFARLHCDPLLDGGRLHTLANTGSVTSHSTWSTTYRGWRKVTPTEADIASLPHVSAPSPFAPQVRSSAARHQDDTLCMT